MNLSISENCGVLHCALFELERKKKKKTTPHAMKTKRELEEVLSSPSVQSGELRNRIAHFKGWAVFFLGPGLGKNGAGAGQRGPTGLPYKGWLDRSTGCL